MTEDSFKIYKVGIIKTTRITTKRFLDKDRTNICFIVVNHQGYRKYLRHLYYLHHNLFCAQDYTAAATVG